MTHGQVSDEPTKTSFKRWKDVLFGVKDQIAEDHLSLVAAGVAFYALLALFPAITALMALAGLLVEPSQITGQIETLAALMPQEAANIILDQAVAVTGSKETGLGWAFLLGLGLAVYSASKGMASLMEGLNVVYDVTEKRGFIERTFWTLGLTVLLIVGLICGLTATLALPVLIGVFGLPVWLENLLSYGRWVLLALMSVAGLSVLYRYGPSRENARWKWITPGTVIACVLWLAASVGFSIYVSNFGSYNETFGSMAGAIILLMWLWISAFIILVGAEINAVLVTPSE